MDQTIHCIYTKSYIQDIINLNKNSIIRINILKNELCGYCGGDLNSHIEIDRGCPHISLKINLSYFPTGGYCIYCGFHFKSHLFEPSNLSLKRKELLPTVKHVVDPIKCTYSREYLYVFSEPFPRGNRYVNPVRDKCNECGRLNKEHCLFACPSKEICMDNFVEGICNKCGLNLESHHPKLREWYLEVREKEEVMCGYTKEHLEKELNIESKYGINEDSCPYCNALISKHKKEPLVNDKDTHLATVYDGDKEPSRADSKDTNSPSLYDRNTKESCIGRLKKFVFGEDSEKTHLLKNFTNLN